MANYGRGWGDGYGSQSKDSVQDFWDKEALKEGDWEWLDKSPTYQKQLREKENNG